VPAGKHLLSAATGTALPARILLRTEWRLMVASVHLELEDDPLDGIKRTWAMKS
jgi:hypothetical protein